MPESAEEVYARVVALVGEDGRLPTPPVSEWDTFPWEADGGELRARRLLPPVEAEAPRNGEGDLPCGRCQDVTGSRDIWRNERWAVTRTEQPTGLPLVLFLQSREHMDFHDMDDELASELGRLTNTLHRIMHYLPNIGRVHIGKWGDGSQHLHVWFIARFERLPQLRGSYAVEWDEILPPVPEDIWRADLHEVARKLATHDGEALV